MLLISGLLGFSILSNNQYHTATASRAFNFDFEFRNSNLVIEPKGEGAAVVDLSNIGDDDTFSLTLESPPTGWKAYFENGKHTFEKFISSGNNYPVRIFLTAPSSGSMLLKVTCRSKGSNTVQNDQASIEAKYIIRTLLEGSSKVQTVKAGGKAEFLLNVTNYQDISDEITLSLEDTFINLQNYADQVSWSAWFDNRSFTLSPGMSRLVKLSIFAPNEGKPGDRVNLVVVADVQSTTQSFNSPEFFAEIPKIYDIDYEIKLRTQSELISPNSTVNYTLKLFNTGNIDTTISLRVLNNPENWGVTFYDDKNKTNPTDKSIKIGGQLEFNIQVWVPLKAKNQTHNITYGIHTKEFYETPLETFNISTIVRLKSKISIALSQQTVNVDLGKTTYTDITVHNEGNGQDIIDLALLDTSIPSDWTLKFDKVKNVYSEANGSTTVDFSKPIKLTYLEPMEFAPIADSHFETISLRLDANKKAFVRLAITAPPTGKASTEEVKIYSESESGTYPTVMVDLNLKLIVSKLEILNINVTPEQPVPGDDVKVKVTVTNNFHLPANDFKVTVTKITDSGPKELGSKEVTSLAAGGDEIVEFRWDEPDEGLKSYIIKVEIKGNIISDENIPHRTKNVLIGEPREEDGGSRGLDLVVMGLTSAIIIAAIIFLVIFLVSRKQGIDDTDELDAESKDEPIGKKPGRGRGKGSRVVAGKNKKNEYDPRITPKGGTAADKLKQKSKNGSRSRTK
jgi:uncharacterized membrane protein